MKAMSAPVQGGSINLLQQFLNIESQSEWALITAWLLGAMRTSGPFPILVLQGEQGTAKSTTARLLKDLIDPSVTQSQSLPRSERDLAITASKSHVLNFDNLSGMKPWLSDAFCRIATGGGFRTRTLYTDDGEQMFNSIRPMIMNGITDISTRHDFADRSLIVQLPVIPKERRRPESEINRYWELSKGKILGALCDALSASLANYEHTTLDYLPRMADFAKWVTAGETTLGMAKRTFLKEWENNRQRLIDIALDADPIALSILDLRAGYHENNGKGKFHLEMTPSSLLQFLNTTQGDRTTLKSWPKQPNVLSGRLRRAATFLREKGIEIEWVKSGDRKIYIYETDEGYSDWTKH
jgi:hypothetical protein